MNKAMGFSSSQVAQASVATQIGAGLTSVVGSVYSAGTQKRSLQSQAAIAEINANIADMGAESALLQGNSEIAKLTMQVGQLKSRQRVSMAANGIDLGVGNAAEIAASTDLMKEVDVDTIRSNAARNAWGYRTQASNLRTEAASNRAAASGISTVGAAASSLLSTASLVGSSWYGLQQEGAFGSTTDTAGVSTNNWW